MRTVTVISGLSASWDDLRWLCSTEAEPWLAEAAGWQDRLAAVERLRRRLAADKARLVVEQVALRRRAVAKFPAAAGMFFTPLGLQQASDEQVAGYKAARFPAAASLADLCCGIGGDLRALAARGGVLGVDRDSRTVQVAAANLRQLQRQAEVGGSGVVLGEVEAVDVAGVAAWHIDPDRRAGRRRTTRVAQYEPGLAVLDALLRANRNAAIKLAPAAEAPPHWTAATEREWISRSGECKQQVCWFGSLAEQPGRRRATILSAGRVRPRTVLERPGTELRMVDGLGEYLFEPDAAVLAARLSAELAAEHGLAGFAADVAYLTGRRPVDDPALACFAVEATLPLDLRRLGAMLRARGIGQVEVKKRAVPHDPEQVRRRLKLSGAEVATLVLTRLRGRVVAVLCHRMGGAGPATSRDDQDL